MNRPFIGLLLAMGIASGCASSEPEAVPLRGETPAVPPSAALPPPTPTVVEAPPVQIRVVEPAAAPPVEPAPAAEPAAVGFREVFPNVQLDAQARAVRFEGVVPIDAHDVNAPWVFLEVVVCTPDTKEHEALVMTRALASHVHAALLLAGLEPGRPARWKFENNELSSLPPEGPEVRVVVSYRDADGVERAYTPQEMIVNAQNSVSFASASRGRWVFAGSQIVQRLGREAYDADAAGTLVGLASFGSETVAWSEVISHEAGVEEPTWIADKRTTPRAGTPVTVTISAVR